MSTAVETKNFPKRVLSLLRFFLHHLIFNLQVAMEYRFSFITQVLFMAINDVLFLFIWWILYQRLPTIGGWSQRETLSLIGVTAGAFGSAVVVAGNVPRLARLIAEGQIDVYLLLPRDPLFHAIIGRTMVAGLGDMLFSAVILWWLGPVTWTGRVLLVTAIAASSVVFIAFGILAHSLAFFIGEATGLSQFLHECLLALGMYPESIYPARMRLLFFTVVPVGFAAFIPVHLIREPNLALLGLAVAFAVLLSRLAWMVFQSGLLRYQSGNLIAARL